MGEGRGARARARVRVRVRARVRTGIPRQGARIGVTKMEEAESGMPTPH